MFSKVMYDGKPAKLEVFKNDHFKWAKSLPIHEKALAAGLRVPCIYNVERKGNILYKYSEWIPANTIQYEMDRDPSLVNPICMDLARYVNALYDVDGITPVDCHFKNFVWYNNQVIYIDLKKLFYENYEGHILHMSKICLKSCRGDRRKVLAFLSGYAKYKNVKPILDDCSNRGWCWKPVKGAAMCIEPITSDEVVTC